MSSSNNFIQHLCVTFKFNPSQTSMNDFLHGLQESPCFAFHHWQGCLLSLRESNHKITNMIPKIDSHRCYPCFRKNNSIINITFYPTNARFFPSISGRRRRIVVLNGYYLKKIYIVQFFLFIYIFKYV
jgi:hypothetical protein